MKGTLSSFAVVMSKLFIGLLWADGEYLRQKFQTLIDRLAALDFAFYLEEEVRLTVYHRGEQLPWLVTRSPRPQWVISRDDGKYLRLSNSFDKPAEAIEALFAILQQYLDHGHDLPPRLTELKYQWLVALRSSLLEAFSRALGCDENREVELKVGSRHCVKAQLHRVTDNHAEVAFCGYLRTFILDTHTTSGWRPIVEVEFDDDPVWKILERVQTTLDNFEEKHWVETVHG